MWAQPQKRHSFNFGVADQHELTVFVIASV